MIKVVVKNLEGKETNAGEFKSQEEVNEWIQKNESVKAFGDPAQYTIEQSDATVVNEKFDKIQLSLLYLKNTDWYVIRENERKISIPDEVSKLREEAIALLNEISKEELDKIKEQMGLL